MSYSGPQVPASAAATRPRNASANTSGNSQRPVSGANLMENLLLGKAREMRARSAGLECGANRGPQGGRRLFKRPRCIPEMSKLDSVEGIDNRTDARTAFVREKYIDC